MGRPRLQLHEILLEITENVYFQPPNGLIMQYPCIAYKRSDVETIHADNKPYSRTKRYQLTIMDQDPDSDIPEKVAALPMCEFDRFYTADNLNHDVYNLYF